MHLSSTRLAYSLAPTVRVGADIGAFELPPIASQTPPAIPVLGPTAAAVTDRPEVREFMHRLLDPQWGMALANRPNSVFHPANLLFNTDHCRTPGLDDQTNALRLQLCRTMHDALADGQVRWDGSDLMPPAIGDVYNGKRGAFFQGMLDYVDQGPTSIDSVLSGIENQWRLQGGLAGS
jgi:hypothetical protein